MIKEFILFIKYPYTAGVIATIWLGSAALVAIDKNLPFIRIVVINMIISVVISAFGFRGKKEI
jgi:hypothetical protein